MQPIAVQHLGRTERIDYCYEALFYITILVRFDPESLCATGGR
jgi:hypothetical protein